MAGTREKAPSGTVRRWIVLVLLAGTLLVLVGRLLSSEDPYRSGTTHDAELVNDDPRCAYWSVALGDDHHWRNTENAPDTWSNAVVGELKILDDDDAVFTAPGGQVRMWGGDLNSEPRKAFTADCPRTLSN